MNANHLFLLGEGQEWKARSLSEMTRRYIPACGSSGAENQIMGSEKSFMSQLMSNYTQSYAGWEQGLNQINSILNPIVQAGPNQQGFNAETLSALNTTALDTTGANYANAARALNSQLAGRGDSAMESGVDQQLKEGLASSAAAQTSGEELGIQEQNYAMGRQQWADALAMKGNVTNMQNPVAFGSLANNANANAFSEAHTINQENNQATADIAGAITGGAMDALTFGAGAMGGGGLAGGMRSLATGGASLVQPGAVAGQTQTPTQMAYYP